MNPFYIGARVYKRRGYAFPGIIRAIFTTSLNEVRYVVENTDAPGLLHIFAGNQLELNNDD